MTTETPPIAPAPIILRGEAGLYWADVATAGLSLRFDHAREDRGALTFDVTVFTLTPGGRPVEYDFLRLNLMAVRAKKELASMVTAATGAPDAEKLVNLVCADIRRRHRQGRPIVNLADVVPQPMTWRLWPLLPNGLPALFVAEGGTGKTTVCAICAVAITSGMAFAGLRPTKGRVLYLDYESSAEDMARLVHAITSAIPDVTTFPDVYYRSCSRPLVDEQEELRAAVMEIKADLVIVDSVSRAAACDDENKAGPVSMFFNALHTFGWRDDSGSHVATSLSCAHTQKGDGGNKTARGSGNWQDQARSVWRLNSTLDGTTHEIGLFDVKRNLRSQQKPVGLRVDYVYGAAQSDDAERTLDEVKVSRADVRDNPALAAHMSAPDRIIASLRGGARSLDGIVAETGLPLEKIRHDVSYLKKTGKVVAVGVGNWGLPSTTEVT